MNQFLKNISPYAFAVILLGLLAGLFSLLLIYQLELSIASSLTDAFLSVFLFAAASFGFRYQIKHIPFGSGRIAAFLLSHLLAGGVISFLWAALVQILLNEFAFIEPAYRSFYSDSFFWRIGAGTLIYLLIITFIYLNRYYTLAAQRAEQESELKRLVTESELKSLRFQIQPHFLFNSLNSIVALTDSEPAKAKEMTIKLSELMRYSLSKETKQFVPLSEELKNAERYIGIEKIRFDERLSFAMDTDESLLSHSIPSLILQPLLENAVKHGIYESTEPVVITLRVQKETGFLKITLSNQFDPEYQRRRGEGVGIANIRKRLEILYGSGNLLKISTDKNIFTVVIFIPLNREEEIKNE